MPIKQEQEEVDKWIKEETSGYWPPLSIMAAMTEEAGELARELNDRFGGRVKKPTDETKDIADELADVLFTIICLANSQKINLDEAWLRKMDKCQGRDKDRFKENNELLE